MEELLEGLDCSLRVTGKNGNSIMMGIVNSAMEEAYEKILCSPDRGLGCLNDKSRFCGLAIMQLEWCLRLLQEEVDACVVETDGVRENLVGDLRVTRDRIQRRLKETESAIAEKDRELADMNETESELRRALESKDEELRTLRTSLEQERARHVGAQEGMVFGGKAGDEIADDDAEVALNELRISIVQHVEDFSFKILEAKTHVSDLIQKLDMYNFSAVESSETKFRTVQEEESCLSFDRTVHETKYVRPSGCPEMHPKSNAEILRCMYRTDLDYLFKQLSLDMGILKRRLILAFEAADKAINLSKIAVYEQQLCWSFEKETLYVLLENFLKDAEESYASKFLGEMEDTPSFFLNGSRLSLMKSFAILHSNLDQVVFQLDKQLETASLVELPASDLMDFVKENSVDHPAHFAAETGRNHESSVRKETQEATSLIAEIYREKWLPFFQNGTELRSMKTKVIEIISKLEFFLEESTMPAVASHDFQSAYKMDMFSLQDNLSKSESVEKAKDILHTSTEVPRKNINEMAFYPMTADVCEETRNLKEDREHSCLQGMVLEETNAVFFHVFVKELYLEFIDYKLLTLLREDISRLIFNETIKERNHEIESSYFEKATIEEIDRIIFIHLIQDMKNDASLGFKRCGEEHLSCPSIFFRGSWIDEEIVQGEDQLAMSFEVEEDLLHDPKSEIMEEQVHFVGNSQMSAEAEQSPNHPETLDEDNAFCSVRSKLEKTPQHIAMSKMQLEELGSDLGVPLEKECAVEKFSSLNDVIRAKKQTSCFPIKNREEGWIQSVITHLTEFSRDITDLELVVYEKTQANMSRLEGLNCQLNYLVQQASSLRKRELRYRKAFVRRCYNLQTAEAEVDLLGDEVDALLRLLEKIYIALDHYSPVLQYYCGMMDILKLIEMELFGDVSLKYHQ